MASLSSSPVSAPRVRVRLSPMLTLILLFVAGASSSTAEASDDGCRVGCPLALAAYYFSMESNLTFIASLFNFSDYNPLLRYNPNITDPNYIITGTRIIVPFSCSCRALPADPASTFLAGSVPYPLSRGQTYGAVAAEFANLTTAAWLEETNAYPADKLPASGTINVAVNCSCGDKGVSPRYGLFLTYPLWEGETLASVAEQYGLSSPAQMELLRRYNPGMDGASGKGIVFIPVQDTDGSYRPLESAGNNLSGGAVAGIVIACVVILIVGIWLFSMYYRQQKKRKSISFSSPEVSVQLASASAEGIKVDRSIEFSYEELSDATHNFSTEHKIGQGGFGSVYYADLRGENAAIKKMDTKASQEFLAELKVLTHVHHLNLVADFGLAKLSEIGATSQSLPTRVVGTFGYMPPEYAQYGEVSPKVDVYAFGIVLYELISGKEAIVRSTEFSGAQSLVHLFDETLSMPDPKEALGELIDPRLGGDYPIDSVLKIAYLARSCTHEAPSLRPTMRSVVVALMALSSKAHELTRGLELSPRELRSG